MHVVEIGGRDYPIEVPGLKELGEIWMGPSFERVEADFAGLTPDLLEVARRIAEGVFGGRLAMPEGHPQAGTMVALIKAWLAFLAISLASGDSSLAESDAIRLAAEAWDGAELPEVAFELAVAGMHRIGESTRGWVADPAEALRHMDRFEDFLKITDLAFGWELFEGAPPSA
jgi:hypothetical protein